MQVTWSLASVRQILSTTHNRPTKNTNLRKTQYNSEVLASHINYYLCLIGLQGHTEASHNDYHAPALGCACRESLCDIDKTT